MADNMECGGEKLLTESGLKYMLKKMTGKILLAVGVVRAEGDAPLSLWREETEDGITIRGSVDLSSCATADGLSEEANARADADTALQSAVDSKQDKLTAGNNITISEDNVISATGGSGGDVDLSEYQKKLKAYTEIEGGGNGYNGVTAKLGETNITFEDFTDMAGDAHSSVATFNTIGAIGELGTITTLGMLGTVGNLCNIAVIGTDEYSTWKTEVFNPWYYHGKGSGDTSEIATKGDIPDLSEYLTKVAAADTYQGKLTAGENITIDSNNVISATGGSEDADLSGRFAGLMRTLEGTDVDVAPKFSAGEESAAYCIIYNLELGFGFTPTVDLGAYPESAVENVMEFMNVFFAKYDTNSHTWTFYTVGNAILSENVDIQGIYPKGFKGLYLGEHFEHGSTEGDAIYMRYHAAYRKYSETEGSVEEQEGTPVEVCWIKLPLVKDDTGSLTVGEITFMEELDVSVSEWNND